MDLQSDSLMTVLWGLAREQSDLDLHCLSKWLLKNFTRQQKQMTFVVIDILHISISIRYKITLFGNNFLKCNIVKRILISFNCFSEYSL